jgi:hypothetical protein
LDQLLDTKIFVGRAPQQVDKFTRPGREVVKVLENYSSGMKDVAVVELNV